MRLNMCQVAQQLTVVETEPFSRVEVLLSCPSVSDRPFLLNEFKGNYTLYLFIHCFVIQYAMYLLTCYLQITIYECNYVHRH